MGIDTDWLKWLQEIAPNGFLKQLPTTQNDVVIIDLTEIVYAFLNSSGERKFVDFQNDVRNRLEWECKINKSLKHFVFLLDNIENAVFCKCVTRIIDREKTCFTNEELVNLGIYESVCLSPADGDSQNEYLGDVHLSSERVMYRITKDAEKGIIGTEPEKYWMTRALRSFIEEKVRDVVITVVKGVNFKAASEACMQYHKGKTSTVAEVRASKFGILVTLDDVPKCLTHLGDREMGAMFDVLNNHKVSTKRGIYVMSHTKEPVIDTFKSSRIGEADIKFMEYIDSKMGESFVLRSKDTDWPLIVLLNMEKFIDPETGNVPMNIYVDRSHAFVKYFVNKKNGVETKKKTEEPWCCIDVVALWRGIIDYFSRNYPNVPNPVETLVTLMLLAKSDYVYPFGILERYMTKTETLIALRMNKGGHALLSTNPTGEKEKKPSNVVTASKIWKTFKASEDFRAMTYTTDKGYFIKRNAPTQGNKYALKTVLVNERRVCSMILHLYKDHFKKMIPEDAKINSFDDLRLASLSFKHKNNMSDRDARMEIPCEAAVKSNARRLNFNIIYWLRAYVPGFKLDLPTERVHLSTITNEIPVELRSKGHMSLFGWKLVHLEARDKKTLSELEENLTLIISENKYSLCVITNEIVPYKFIESLPVYEKLIRHLAC